MNVAKASIDAAADDRPLAVRARQHREHRGASAARPRRRSASPRRASRRGCPRRRGTRRPGTIASSPSGVRTRPRTSAASVAGHSTYGASTQPCRLPIIPQAIRGAALVAPVAEQRRERGGERRRGPAGCRAAPRARRARRRAPSRRYARADVVPQSIAINAARGSRHARRGARRADARHVVGSGARRCQRAAASSSLARASTQRAPAGVSSFFQNGARVLR